MAIFYAVLPLLLAIFANAIPIPNGQIGKAEVECGEEAIEIVFLTEDVFQGRVFVVGHANEPGCFSREVGRRTTSISIRKDQCGVVTTRSTNPPGLFVNVKVLISFHEDFITKIDRGYEISCFYMQSEKTVTYPLTVSPNTLVPLTEIAEMPRCHYEVVDPATMQPVSVVAIGSKLLHKWACDSTSPDLWCMQVHSCFIEDGAGTEIVILNDDGCAIDRYLLDNLEYGPGPLQAQKEAHAFKFADKVVVNFQCSIRLDIRDGECPVPKCPDLTNQKPRLNKRSHKELPPVLSGGAVEVDVRAQQVDVLDPQIGERLGQPPIRIVQNTGQNPRCVPIESLVIPASLCLTTILSMLSVIVYMTVSQRKTKL